MARPKGSKNKWPSDKATPGASLLSPNEQAVLRAMCHEPWANDRLLSRSSGFKMSTITAIKNRLKKGGLFRKANIPAYHRLGYTLLSTSMTKMDIGDADMQGGGLPGTAVVFTVRDPLGCFVLAVHKGYEDHQAFTDMLDGITGGKEGSKCHHGPWHHDIFVLRNGRRVAEFDFTNAVGRAFQLDEFDNHPPVSLDGEQYKMTRKVIPKVLRGLLAMPEALAIALVKPTGVTRQSITKTMYLLKRDGIIGRTTLVDLKTMGMELVTVMKLRIDDGGTKGKGRKTLGKAISNIETIVRPFWYFVFGDDHILLSYHANYDQYMESMAEISRIRGVAGLRTHVFGTRGGNVRYRFEVG
jgi:hypothetical protein